MSRPTKPISVLSDNIISPLGRTTDENYRQLKAGVSAIRNHQDQARSPQPFYASLLSQGLPAPDLSSPGAYTLFEQLLIDSAANALEGTGVSLGDPRTVLIISSTKGNISLLESDPGQPRPLERISLHSSGLRVAQCLGYNRAPLIVSNACISGLLAMLTGMRLIESGSYDHAVVTGCDLITKFILSGFQSFQAVSARPCRPFDLDRDGITLGEAAATVVLSALGAKQDFIKIRGGSVTNDANHISGPSRTGEELAMAIGHALQQAGLSPSEIDFVSAHGTATPYNDEMEAKAISLAGLREVPVNSLKGYYGHTLGAAGLVESIISLHSLQDSLVLPTPGYNQPGVSEPIHISSNLQPLMRSRNFLKTASGFGGCNAALVFGR